MSCKINFKKASTLPAKPNKNTLYFIENGDYAETYLTDNKGNPKKVGNTIMITEVTSGLGDKNYIHDQGTPNTIWTISHGLNKKPSVTVIDTAGTEVEGHVEYIDNNNVIIVFNSSFSGTATLN